jgi:tripartite-type tricarboxylate transporter receptor subunit TctC
MTITNAWLGQTACNCLAIAGILLLPTSLMAQPTGTAQDFPAKPIRMVVGFTPGGTLPDTTARLIGPRIYEVWNQQVIVENRPGAGGVIAADIVAKANPDGYTLLSASSGHASIPAIHASLPYDTLKDFAGVTLTSRGAFLLVVAANSEIKSVKELIAQAKAHPGKLNFGSAGTGSGTHFAVELFREIAKIEMVHVAYKGPAEAVTDTIAGRVQFFMPPLGSAAGLVKDGKLLALAVGTSKRVPGYMDIPTLAESGVTGYEWDAWSGILAPAKTPRAVIEKLNREITRILSLAEVQQRLLASGVEAAPTTPAQFDKLIADQVALTSRLARTAGIKIN